MTDGVLRSQVFPCCMHCTGRWELHRRPLPFIGSSQQAAGSSEQAEEISQKVQSSVAPL